MIARASDRGAGLGPLPPEVHEFIVGAWRRTPRPSLRQIALEVTERFGRPVNHRTVARVLEQVAGISPGHAHAGVARPASERPDPEAVIRDPRFDDPEWLGAERARILREALAEFRGRPRAAAARGAGAGTGTPRGRKRS